LKYHSLANEKGVDCVIRVISKKRGSTWGENYPNFGEKKA
jgi:hypothetical protein